MYRKVWLVSRGETRAVSNNPDSESDCDTASESLGGSNMSFEVIFGVAPRGFLEVTNLASHIGVHNSVHDVRATFRRELAFCFDCQIAWPRVKPVASKVGWFNDDVMDIGMAMLCSRLEFTEVLSNHALRGMYRVGNWVGQAQQGKVTPSYSIWGVEEPLQPDAGSRSQPQIAVLSSYVYPLSKAAKFPIASEATEPGKRGLDAAADAMAIFNDAWKVGQIWLSAVLPLVSEHCSESAIGSGVDATSELQTFDTQSQAATGSDISDIARAVHQRSILFRQNIIAFPAMDASHWVGAAVVGLEDLAKYLVEYDNILNQSGNGTCGMPRSPVSTKPNTHKRIAVYFFDSTRDARKEQNEMEDCLKELSNESVHFIARSAASGTGTVPGVTPASSENTASGNSEEQRPSWSLYMLRKLFDLQEQVFSDGQSEIPESDTLELPGEVNSNFCSLKRNLKKMKRMLEEEAGLIKKASYIARGLAVTWVIHRSFELYLAAENRKTPPSPGADKSRKEAGQELNAANFNAKLKKWARKAWENDDGKFETKKFLSAIQTFTSIIENRMLCMHVDVPRQSDSSQCGPMTLLALDSFIYNEQFRAQCQAQMEGVYRENMGLSCEKNYEESSPKTCTAYDEDGAFALRVRFALFLGSIFQESFMEG